MASIKDWFQRVIISLKDQTPVDDDNGLPVKVVGTDSDITLTGDVVVDTLGALDDAKVVDPDAASATLPALLRGVLKQEVDILAKLPTGGATDAKLDDIITALGDIADKLDTANAALATIATNTAP